STCDKIRNVISVIELLRKKINDIEPVMKEKAENFIEIPDQYLDASKLRALGFTPAVNFSEGIDRTIAWYKKYFDDLAPLAERYIVHK
ncbi:MAG TPA: hypothetical protein VEA18_04080, partial [Candidatus Kapabacteria bacterium]|nr:hypothetical protein [Candidatus Kapabacteria bacterium]